tara:strand:- start:1682 stop:2368 length:687 start_codon:yes stop_codon:yes gene_type:complete
MSKRHPKREGGYVREFIFGFNDGLVSTLALVAGLTGAALQSTTVIIAGLAAIIAGSISMALGAYISSKSQKEVYLNEIEREKEHIKKSPKTELKELCILYQKKGFTKKEAEIICKGLQRNKKRWLNVMSQELFGFAEEFKDLKKITIIMGLSFILGALIPLTPYFFFNVTNALWISIFASAIGLFLIGIGKCKFTQRSPFKSGLEMLAVGAIATIISYYAGYLVGIVI